MDRIIPTSNNLLKCVICALPEARPMLPLEDNTGWEFREHTGHQKYIKHTRCHVKKKVIETSTTADVTSQTMTGALNF